MSHANFEGPATSWPFGFTNMEEAEKYELLFSRREAFDQQVRGQVIYAAVRVESAIEQIISIHFCEEQKQPMFISLLFLVGQVTFSQKLIILKKLLKEEYPDIFRLFPSMFNRLEKIRELRNKLAHSKIGYSFPIDAEEFQALLENDSEEGTTLEYFKDGVMVHEEITKQAVQDSLETANAYQNILDYVYMEVKNRVSNSQNANFQIALRYLRYRYPDKVVPADS